MAKYKQRKYICPVCETEQMVGTNHIGEIYSGCKNTGCRYSPLQCIEPEAIKVRESRPVIQSVFHYYRFNLDKGEKEAYMSVVKKLVGYGYEPFDSIGGFGDIAHPTALSRRMKMMGKKFDGETVHLITDQVFDNQWSSREGLRLHDWYEVIYDNKDIKEGYWLEWTDEMKQIRKGIESGK